MLLEEAHGLQMTPTKWLCPNRQPAGTTATQTSQFCPRKSTSQNQFAFTHKKLKPKPNWEDRVLAVGKWKNAAGHPVRSVFQKGDPPDFVERFLIHLFNTIWFGGVGPEPLPKPGSLVEPQCGDELLPLLPMHQCAPPAFGAFMTEEMSRKTNNAKAEVQINCYPSQSSSVEQEHLPLCRRASRPSKHFPEGSPCRGCSNFRYQNVFLHAVLSHPGDKVFLHKTGTL